VVIEDSLRREVLSSRDYVLDVDHTSAGGLLYVRVVLSDEASLPVGCLVRSESVLSWLLRFQESRSHAPVVQGSRVVSLL